MGLGALLILCYGVVRVSAVLLPPRDLTISSQNFKHILTWRDPNNVTSISYRVMYSPMYSEFLELTDCSNVTTPRCDLTKDFTEINNYYSVKVLSFTDRESSKESRAISLTPIMNTVLGPPIVDIVTRDHNIQVSIRPPVSYLWSKEEHQYVSMVSHDVFPRMNCKIMVQNNTEVSFHDEHISKENTTFTYSVLPNTNYCVSVNVIADSNFKPLKPPISSEMKCVVTDGHGSGSSTLYIVVSVVCGVLLLVGLVLFLSGLDKAGFICKVKTRIPKVLKSLPTSTSTFFDTSEFASPTFSIHVDISEKFEVEQRPEHKSCDGGYANRKRLVDSDTSGTTTTSGELPSAVSSSVGSSGQEEDLSTGHRGDGASSAVCKLGSASITRIPAKTKDDSSNLPLDTSGVFNINMDSVSIADPNKLWTGVGQIEVHQQEAKDSTESQEVGIAMDQCNDICLDDDLAEQYCSDYGEEEEISENENSDSQLVSGYMRR
ncbi:interferon alpha/beta receptor 2-like isoform 1-T4 [Anomaloglossus baeobatrachus]|uniref:interferon alpha/beta receptor 2-like n=1 Tax=Anomaloglossus baeobatrachus TaxID=238106 RepID=UPI003F504347